MIKISLMNAKELAKQSGYILKVVTSVGLFDNYDMFHNIYEQYEEPCRRMAVMTKDSALEEVYENKNCSLPFISYGNICIKEFPMTIALSEIDLDNIWLTKDEYALIETMI